MFFNKIHVKSNCDVGVIAQSPASVHLLRLQWPPWESKRVDPVDQCNSDAEHDTDIMEVAASYGPDIDNPYGTW